MSKKYFLHRLAQINTNYHEFLSTLRLRSGSMVSAVEPSNCHELKHRLAQIFLKGVIIFFGIILGNADFAYTMDLGRHKTAEPSGKFLKAMDFTLPDLAGNHVSLKDFENKKIVLLTFWATWCPYCRQEVNILKKIYDKYNNKEVEILAVDIRESRERVSRFIEEEKVPYRVLLDFKREVSRLYQVVGVPTDVIIDREGKVRYYDFGWPDNLEEIIDKLLAENPK